MRTRLIIAFVVVALLAAIASSWFHTLIESYHLPGWLDGVILGPGWLRRLVLAYAGQPPLHPARHTALVFFGVEAGVLLGVIITAAIAASSPVGLGISHSRTNRPARAARSESVARCKRWPVV